MHKILYMFQVLCAHHQEVKIVLNSIWYHRTETSEWSKITKIQFYKYEHIVVKSMYEYFRCDYCILLTINMLCHVEVTFIQLLNLLHSAYFPRCHPEDIVFLMHWCYSKLLRLFPILVACTGNYNFILDKINHRVS